MKKDKTKKFFHQTAAFLYKHRRLFVKLLIALLTLAVSVILIFFLLRLMPGDVVQTYALKLQGQRNISYEEAYKLATKLLNYDPNENIFVSFFNYVGGLFQGNFGTSLYIQDVTTVSLIADRLPWTLLVSSIALLISFTVGTWLGAKMARKRNGLLDTLGTSYIVVSSSVPDYLVGLLLVFVFAYRLNVFPASGNYDAFVCTPGFNLP
ncbi:MAG: ABC transporter permease, partial [Candidatus Fimimonas sp.]